MVCTMYHITHALYAVLLNIGSQRCGFIYHAGAGQGEDTMGRKTKVRHRLRARPFGYWVVYIYDLPQSL